MYHQWRPTRPEPQAYLSPRLRAAAQMVVWLAVVAFLASFWVGFLFG